MRIGILWVIGLLLLPGQQVFAADQCRLPDQIKAWDYRATEAIRRGKDWRNAQVKTDYWMLALSWSKAFCDQRRNDANPQCRDNAFGLILHGLWAQSRVAGRNYKGHPRNCVDAQAIPATLIRQYWCMIPGARLMQKAWEKHGTCDFKQPEAYLKQAKQLYEQLTLPTRAMLLTVERKRPSDIKQMMVKLNQRLGLKRKHIWVDMKQRRLREIRICYDLAFRFADCRASSSRR